MRKVDVRHGSYQDSVSLMLVSREVQQVADVSAALIAMGTELNLDLLGDLGFERPDGAGPNDMVVAIEAIDGDAIEAALATLATALARKPARANGVPEEAQPPRTVASAASRCDATLAVISTPGSVAAIDAADALGAGLDAFIFSDNVSLESEIALKQLAERNGSLVMGPDCGTAVVDGVGLGFANVVRPGPVGIVAASGTGAQHLMSLLDQAGVGVTHCLGVGGRDLSSAVGGRSTRVALDRLAGDDRIELIAIISKPPAHEVAAEISAHAAALDTPVVFGYLTPDQPDITVTARSVVERLGKTWAAPQRRAPESARASRPGHLRGLFTGGTLCDEAMLIGLADGLAIASNIPLQGQQRLDSSLSSIDSTFIDFGDDQLTVGRPHPMIDPTLRLDRLERELADDTCAVVLLDVVLGHAAHPRPADELAPVIAASSTPVVVSIVGTRDDPQDTEATARALAAAGAIVHASNSAAMRESLAILRQGAP